MSMPDERWMGRVEQKLDDVSIDVKEIKEHLKVQNSKIQEVMVKERIDELKIQSNEESIGSLDKKISRSKLSMRDKAVLWGVIITGIFSIAVAVIMRFR